MDRYSLRPSLLTELMMKARWSMFFTTVLLISVCWTQVFWEIIPSFSSLLLEQKLVSLAHWSEHKFIMCNELRCNERDSQPRVSKQIVSCQHTWQYENNPSEEGSDIRKGMLLQLHLTRTVLDEVWVTGLLPAFSPSCVPLRMHSSRHELHKSRPCLPRRMILGL